MTLQPGQYGLFGLGDDLEYHPDEYSKAFKCVSVTDRTYIVIWNENLSSDEEHIFKARLRKIYTKEEHPEMYL